MMFSGLLFLLLFGFAVAEESDDDLQSFVTVNAPVDLTIRLDTNIYSFRI